MESVNGYESNGYPYSSGFRGSSESVSESVASYTPRTTTKVTKANKVRPTDSPRIQQLRAELADLQEELTLTEEIDAAKAKIKKYQRQ